MSSKSEREQYDSSYSSSKLPVAKSDSTPSKMPDDIASFDSSSSSGVISKVTGTAAAAKQKITETASGTAAAAKQKITQTAQVAKDKLTDVSPATTTAARGQWVTARLFWQQLRAEPVVLQIVTALIFITNVIAPLFDIQRKEHIAILCCYFATSTLAHFLFHASLTNKLAPLSSLHLSEKFQVTNMLAHIIVWGPMLLWLISTLPEVQFIREAVFTPISGLISLPSWLMSSSQPSYTEQLKGKAASWKESAMDKAEDVSNRAQELKDSATHKAHELYDKVTNKHKSTVATAASVAASTVTGAFEQAYHFVLPHSILLFNGLIVASDFTRLFIMFAVQRRFSKPQFGEKKGGEQQQSSS